MKNMNKIGVALIAISIILVSFYFFVENWSFENGGIFKALTNYASSVALLYIGFWMIKKQFKKKKPQENLWSKKFKR